MNTGIPSTATVQFMQKERLRAEAAIEPDAPAAGPVTPLRLLPLHGSDISPTMSPGPSIATSRVPLRSPSTVTSTAPSITANIESP